MLSRYKYLYFFHMKVVSFSFTFFKVNHIFPSPPNPIASYATHNSSYARLLTLTKWPCSSMTQAIVLRAEGCVFSFACGNAPLGLLISKRFYLAVWTLCWSSKFELLDFWGITHWSRLTFVLVLSSLIVLFFKSHSSLYYIFSVLQTMCKYCSSLIKFVWYFKIAFYNSNSVLKISVSISLFTIFLWAECGFCLKA